MLAAGTVKIIGIIALSLGGLMMTFAPFSNLIYHGSLVNEAENYSVLSKDTYSQWS